jgi:hypothetical protein
MQDALSCARAHIRDALAYLERARSVLANGTPGGPGTTIDDAESALRRTLRDLSDDDSAPGVPRRPARPLMDNLTLEPRALPRQWDGPLRLRIADVDAPHLRAASSTSFQS